MTFRTLLLATILSALTATAALADSTKVGKIMLDDAWTRATAPSMKNGGAYVTIRNTGTADDKLVAASTPAAARAELHTHRMETGIMKMRPVEDIPVPAGETVELKPGSLHVMMFDLKAPLAIDSTIEVTLTFAKAGKVTLTVPVLAAGAHGAPGHHHGSGSDHGDGDLNKDGTMKKMESMPQKR